MRFPPYQRTLSPPSRVSERGNTIIEYGVIGALGVVAVIVGMQATGGNLNDLFNLFKKGMSAQAQVTQTTKPASPQSAPSSGLSAQINVAAVPASLPQAVLPPEALPLANDAPTGTAATTTPTPTQTAGVNGNTDYFAQTIEDQAQQALAEGTISQANYNLLIQLANKGHEVAQLQSFIEQAAAIANGNDSVYKSQTFTFNGVSYTTQQIAGLLSASTDAVLSLSIKVQTDMSMPSSVADSVNDAGQEIYSNGIETASTASSALTASSVASSSKGSNGTNGESAKICNTGKGTDSGANCAS